MKARNRKPPFERKLLAYSAMASAVLAAGEVSAADCNGAQVGSLCYSNVPDQTINSGMIPIDFDGDGDHEFELMFDESNNYASYIIDRHATAILQPRAGANDLGSAILGGFTSSTRGPDLSRPAALIAGDEVGAAGVGSWDSTGELGAWHQTGTVWMYRSWVEGNLMGRGQRFAGVKIVLDGASIHYGWVRVTVRTSYYLDSVTLHDYAFEMTPSEPCSTDTTEIDKVFADGFESGDTSAWSTSTQ